MRIFKDERDSLAFGLSFFMIFGSVIGSLFCNGMNEDVKRGLLVTEETLITTTILAKMDYGQLFLRIAPRRIWILILGMLISSTPAASFLFFLTAACGGFSTAIVISSLTMSEGFLSIVKYLLLLFPQGILYMAAGYVLVWWMTINKRKLTFFSALFLMLLVLLGTAAETFINPWVLAVFT